MIKLTGIALALAVLAGPALADTIVAPGGPGDAQGPAPIRYYGNTGSEVQQIYSSTFFTGPTQITGLSFRAYPGATPGFFSNSVSVSNLIITASTTALSAYENAGLQPSTLFSANLGDAAATVFSGALTLTTAATGTGPQPFDYTINFTNSFLYNPAAGNLLLDFLIPNGATVSGSSFGFLTFDNANDNNDGVRSIVNINGPGPSGVLDTSAAITQFSTAGVSAVPEPSVWALMIGGMLMAGSALRMQRRSRVRVRA